MFCILFWGVKVAEAKQYCVSPPTGSPSGNPAGAPPTRGPTRGPTEPPAPTPLPSRSPTPLPSNSPTISWRDKLKSRQRLLESTAQAGTDDTFTAVVVAGGSLVLLLIGLACCQIKKCRKEQKQNSATEESEGFDAFLFTCYIHWFSFFICFSEAKQIMSTTYNSQVYTRCHQKWSGVFG